MSHTFSAVPIPGKFGYGTMNLSWNPQPPPIEHLIEVLKFITEHDEFGTKLINAGEFYGPDNANLKIIQKFLESNTAEENEKLIVSIKGCFDTNTFSPDGSREGVARSVDNILQFFPKKGGKGRPKLLFEPARVDPNHPYEKTIDYVADYVDDGRIDGISLSEVGIGSIKKALSVAAVLCVELELSLLCTDILTNGIIDELTRHNIPVVAYSPLCRGFLTDKTALHADVWVEQMDKNDMRRSLDKFLGDNYTANVKLVEALYDYAHNKKGISLEKLSLSWILSLSENKNYRGRTITKILPIPGGSTNERIASNLSGLVKLSLKDLEEIDQILEKFPVKGLRYNAASEHLNFA